jgi:hypothetical protein
MPDDLVKPHSATRKVDALNRSHRIPVGRERRDMLKSCGSQIS